MKDKPMSGPSPKADVPYNAKSKAVVAEFWDSAISHCGTQELRAKRGRPAKAEIDRKEQIALRLDAECWPGTAGWVPAGRGG